MVMVVVSLDSAETSDLIEELQERGEWSPDDDVSLSDFETDDIIAELEYRGFPSADSALRLVEQYRLNGDACPLIDYVHEMAYGHIRIE